MSKWMVSKISTKDWMCTEKRLKGRVLQLPALRRPPSPAVVQILQQSCKLFGLLRNGVPCLVCVLEGGAFSRAAETKCGFDSAWIKKQTDMKSLAERVIGHTVFLWCRSASGPEPLRRMEWKFVPSSISEGMVPILVATVWQYVRQPEITDRKKKKTQKEPRNNKK